MFGLVTHQGSKRVTTKPMLYSLFQFPILICWANLGPFLIEGARSGLKFGHGGYLVYTSNFPVNTSSVMISGVFSTANTTQKQTVFAIEDKNGTFLCQASIKENGYFQVFAYTNTGTATATLDKVLEPKSPLMYRLNSGVSFNFTATCEMSKEYDINGTLEGVTHTIKGDIKEWKVPTADRVVNHMMKSEGWNFENAKIYIGGYRPGVPISFTGSSFTGCMSDVRIQGKNLIATYFFQSSSKHTNPVGAGHVLPQNATACNDVMRTTLAPSTTRASQTHQPKSGTTGLISLLNIVVGLCSIACSLVLSN